MTDQPRRISRALISVSDKSGLVELARALAQHGVELVSTGGTRKALADAGLKVLDVSELTGFPEMMDGRVKTLHPKVHGGLLAIRENKDHADAMQTHGIRPIDLLVVNLYPFEATAAKGADFDTCIENIDIGGPAMIRAAAKNHADVTVVVDPSDYAPLLAELEAARRRDHAGAAEEARRQGLCAHRRLRRRHRQLVRRATGRSGARLSRGRRAARRAAALRREPASIGGVLSHARAARRRRHRAAAAGQAAFLQQLQRHRRGLRVRRRVRSQAHRRLRDRQARQPVRGGGRREPHRRLPQGARLRPGVGVRRHRGAQPDARRRGGARDHRDLHRGDHRAGRQRGSDRHRRRQEEPAPAAGRRRCPIRAPAA